jgi:hypothetical protein
VDTAPGNEKFLLHEIRVQSLFLNVLGDNILCLLGILGQNRFIIPCNEMGGEPTVAEACADYPVGRQVDWIFIVYDDILRDVL